MLRLAVMSVLLACVAVRADDIDELKMKLRSNPGLTPQLGDNRLAEVEPSPEALGLGSRLSEAFAAGGAPRSGPGVATVAPDERQQQSLARLRAKAGPDLTVRWRRENATAAQIRGGILQSAATGLLPADAHRRSEITARRFLNDHADLLRIKAPDQELQLTTRVEGDAGGTHVRFTQWHRGVPVWPTGMSVHLDARGDAVLFDGAYIPTPADIDTTPLVDAAEARRRALAALDGKLVWELSEPVLIVFGPLDGEPRLGWRIEASSGLAQAWLLVIDARTGDVLHRVNRVCHAGVTGSGKDLEGQVRKLNVWAEGGAHYLIDTSKTMFQSASNPITDPKGAITIVDAANKSINALKLNEVVNITSPTPDGWTIPDGVSAAYNFSVTYDYFLQQHARNSLDGRGGNITAIVRINEYDNASWNGNLAIMLFGNAKPYASALDVVGHELVHGLTQNSAGLVYENQSGAMNESFSDIFGEMTEAWSVGQPDWKMGTKLNKVFRDFKNPGAITIAGLNRPYPSKMSEFVDLPNTDDADHGGVHINSSIFNHAFYLVAEGVDGGVGIRDAEKIFYRCLTQHLQPQSQFIDARLGCLSAAEALFGANSTQARKTAAAFDAVEIFDRPETPAPAPTPAVQGPDATLFVYFDMLSFGYNLGRRESAQGDSPVGFVLAEVIRPARPAVSGDGSGAMFISEDFDLCTVETANPLSRQCLGFSGFVHAIALSPDQHFAAFVLRDPTSGQPDNKINVVDLVKNTSRTFQLLAPVLDGSPVDEVLYADSMTFSTDGAVLFYDAVSRLKFGGGPTVERWSIYSFNLATEKISVIVPPLEGLDTGNPAIGRTGNRYISFDAISRATKKSSVLVLDLFTGDAGVIGEVPDGIGYPAFTGDDTALVYAAPDPQATISGFSLFQQPLSANRVAPQGARSLLYQDAALGVIYRRGTFVGVNSPPVANITTPVSGARFTMPATVNIAVTASDADGSVAMVEFYDGSVKLGEAAQAPFAFSWPNAPEGTHRLIARAHDNLGAVADSAPIEITVAGAGGGAMQLSGEWTGGGAFRIRLNAAQGGYTLEKSEDMRAWRTAGVLNIGAGGAASLDDAEPPRTGNALFYRARRN
jgi:Zn-dependent metalloprotease